MTEITEVGQLKQGMHVMCKIKGQEIRDAKISIGSVSGRKCIYICQNARDGANASDRLGYRYSWIIYEDNLLGYNPLKYQVTDLVCTDTKGVIAENNMDTIKLVDKIYKKTRKRSFRYALGIMLDKLRYSNVYDHIDSSNDSLFILHFVKDIPENTLNFESCSRIMSIGRYIRRILNISDSELSSSDLEELCSRMYMVYFGCDNSMFTELSGKDIIKAYRNSIGASSCMTGAGLEHRIRFYADFPDRIKLLVYNKNKGRAILWKLDDGTKYLDRVYSRQPGVADAYRKWAKANSVKCKTIDRLKYDKDLFTVSWDGGSRSYRLPYLDSFMHISDDPYKIVLRPK